MNSSIIIQVLDKLIGPTNPVGDSAVDDVRLNNLRSLIDVINWGLDGLFDSAKDRHKLEYSIRGNAETAYSAIEEIKTWCEEVLEENK